MLDDFGLYLPAVVGEVDRLSWHQPGGVYEPEAGPYELPAGVLGRGVPEGQAFLSAVEPHRVPGARGYVQSPELLQVGLLGVVNRANDARVVLTVGCQGAHPGTDDAALGELPAGRHGDVVVGRAAELVSGVASPAPGLQLGPASRCRGVLLLDFRDRAFFRCTRVHRLQDTQKLHT